MNEEMSLEQACFFNIFEKTQAQKNSRFQKTQGNLSSKLNKTVVMVVTSILELVIFWNFCVQIWLVTQNCTEIFAEILLFCYNVACETKNYEAP